MQIEEFRVEEDLPKPTPRPLNGATPITQPLQAPAKNSLPSGALSLSLPREAQFNFGLLRETMAHSTQSHRELRNRRQALCMRSSQWLVPSHKSFTTGDGTRPGDPSRHVPQLSGRGF